MKKKWIKKLNTFKKHEMKPNRKIQGLLILLMLTTGLSAQNTNCSFRKTFPAKGGTTTLRLLNKYGDVNVITVNDDSLTVCASITIIQDNAELIKQCVKLITFNTQKLTDTIYISTLYDKKFFSTESREGRTSFSVDYVINIPASLNLNITNEFGNISIDELAGTLNVRLSQGTLTAKKLTKGKEKPMSTVWVDHGKVNISELNWMTLSVVNCLSVNIDKAQALMMSSVISKIKMGEISSLICDSKSDSYNIRSINNIISGSTYSTYEIGKLNGQLKSKSIYGSLSIADLDKGFSSIDIVASQTQISLKNISGVSFKTDLIGSDAQVDIQADKYPGILRTTSNFSTTLSGIAGIDKNTKSLVTIRATGGKVSIQ
jgi:hypothetical protein